MSELEKIVINIELTKDLIYFDMINNKVDNDEYYCGYTLGKIVGKLKILGQLNILSFDEVKEYLDIIDEIKGGTLYEQI